MKSSYKTLNNAEDELIIKKSRFKTFIFNIRSEAEATNIISQVREKYRDATHVCHAYILGVNSNVERFSDDGEPSGTAGMPMLEAIKHSGYSEVLAIVVRYFGGIKLGGGGLIRAYSECVKNCIKLAKEVEFTFCNIFEFELDFSKGKKISQYLANIVCKTLEIRYNDRGTYYLVAAREDIDIEKLVTDFTSGKTTAKLVAKEYIEL